MDTFSTTSVHLQLQTFCCYSSLWLGQSDHLSASTLCIAVFIFILTVIAIFLFLNRTWKSPLWHWCSPWQWGYHGPHFGLGSWPRLGAELGDLSRKFPGADLSSSDTRKRLGILCHLLIFFRRKLFKASGSLCQTSERHQDGIES